jgi:endoglucanase
VPFRWERLQPVLCVDLDAEEFQRLDAVVRYATSRGLNVLLDVHNYASYRREVIGTQAVPVDALPGLWGPLAARYKSNDKVIFGLMNEPKGLRTEIWLEAANAAAAAIRTSGARNLIFVPGNGWSGAHSWLARNYGSPNGEAMLGFSDLAQNYAYEVHQYLDSNFSGTHPACRNESIGVTTLTPFTQWLRQNHKRAFLGEFGAGADPTCLAALDAMLAFLDQNRDVWLGWTYWAAGPWPNDYFTSLQPIDGADRPQMAVLLRHIARRGNGGR